MRPLLLPLLSALLLALPPAGEAQIPGTPDARGIPTIAPVIETVTDAVVNISAESEEPVQQSPLFRDPRFRDFFDIPEMPEQRQRVSVGSGVIVDAGEGYVLTNHHVVADADRIAIRLKDRREFEAELLGSDPATDIALLKIAPEGLTALPVGDSESLLVGDFVVAVGNPFGLGQTVTSGIVSALGRTGINPRGYEDFIQTDASINPGNSGGALVTLDGRLVGINTAIVSRSGGNIGIGFAVPMHMALNVMEQIVEYGEVRRGLLGVMIRDLGPDLAEALDVPRARGAVINEVQPGTAAEEAGLRAGDVITGVNGTPVDGASDLRNRIGMMQPGAEVTLTYVRAGEERSVTAVLRSRTDEEGQPVLPSGTQPPALAGVELKDLGPGHPAHGEVDGIAVTAVAADSPAAEAGLRTGDVITAVNGASVASKADLDAAVAAAPATIALTVWRDGRELLIVLTEG